jgi:glutamine amidotransferase
LRVAVLKYNAGNIISVTNALERIGVEVDWTDVPERLASADRVIFPGVGEAGSAMAYLSERSLDRCLADLKQPVLGICLGLQLLCTHSDENDTAGIGVFDMNVRRFPPRDKVPHIGWNTVSETRGPLFRDQPPETYLYFVHSYYAEIGEQTIATTDYIVPFTAAAMKDNFVGFQFHPEKSGLAGEKLLRSFLSL